MLQQGVHVFARLVVGREMTDQHFVGADAKKVLEATFDTLPGPLAVDLRKQMSDVVEGTAKPDRYGLIKAVEISDGDSHAWLQVRAVGVVS